MKIAAYYSHLNGLEWLLQTKPTIWKEIKSAINDVDANACKTKISKEKTMLGKMLYAPTELNKRFKDELHTIRSWFQLYVVRAYGTT